MPSSLAQMFRINPNMFPGTNPGAFNDEFNREIRQSVEPQREVEILEDSYHRADQSMAADLEEANQTRGLRSMGFMGTNPRRQASDYAMQNELQMKLLPEQMKLEAALADKAAAREFTGGQNELNRQNRLDAARMTQEGQTSRTNIQQQNINARQQQAQYAKRPGMLKFYDWITGTKTPQGAATPATQGNDGSGQVLMQAPDGEQRWVSAGEVQKYIARGGTVVE